MQRDLLEPGAGGMRRMLTQLGSLATTLGSLALLGGCSLLYQRTPIDPQAQQVCFSSPFPEGHGHRGKHFQHVLIIVLENQGYDAVMRNGYFAYLASLGANLENFHALFHPSYSNYLAMVSGTEIRSFADIQRTVDKPTIACALHRQGLTWTAYAEDYVPGHDFCNVESRRGLFVRKHVPFLSFRAIQEDLRNGCSKVVPGTELLKTLERHETLPSYMFFTPNMVHDGHDRSPDPRYTQLEYAANWLQHFLEDLDKYPDFRNQTLVLVTFDESVATDATNHIYTVLLGPMVKKNSYTQSYTHYSVLRMIENNFGLGTLADGDLLSNPVEVFMD